MIRATDAQRVALFLARGEQIRLSEQGDGGGGHDFGRQAHAFVGDGRAPLRDYLQVCSGEPTAKHGLKHCAVGTSQLTSPTSVEPYKILLFGA